MLEIILGIYGLYVLVTGKMKLSATKEVVGAPARLIALIMLAPFPIAFAAGLGVGFVAGMNGQDIGDLRMTLMLMEVGIVVACAIAAFSIAHAIGKPPGAAQPQFPTEFGANPPYPQRPSDPNNPYQPPSI
ncbi:MAG TPA: hypothetical protein VFB80_16195 [Pirellulaceae bacterium]|nr:hypothetical protein [Pirellulaceae bacterium]